MGTVGLEAMWGTVGDIEGPEGQGGQWDVGELMMEMGDSRDSRRHLGDWRELEGWGNGGQLGTDGDRWDGGELGAMGTVGDIGDWREWGTKGDSGGHREWGQWGTLRDSGGWWGQGDVEGLVLEVWDSRGHGGIQGDQTGLERRGGGNGDKWRKGGRAVRAPPAWHLGGRQ